MKISENFQKDVRDSIESEQFLSATETGIIAKVNKHLRIIIFLTSFAGMALFFYACAPGYVVTQPTYVEDSRPPQPSSLHIWVGGNWVYSRQNHAYERKSGYWERPNQGRTYEEGHWESSPRGQYWVSGRWHRQTRQVDQYNR